MENITFNKKTLEIIKDLTPIANSLVIYKNGDNIEVIQSNDAESLGFVLKAKKENFNFSSDKVSFLNFKEFYNLLTVLGDDINLSQIDDAHINISNEDNIINYKLTADDIVESNEIDDDFGETDVSLKIDQKTLVEIRKMINIIENGTTNPSSIKISVSPEKVILFFHNKDNGDISYTKKFESNSKISFECTFSSDMFKNIPKGDYLIELKEEALIRLSMASLDFSIGSLVIYAGSDEE